MLPPECRFEHAIPNIGEMKHDTIREYAVALLTWIAFESGLDEVQGEELLKALKAIVHTRSHPIESSSFITEHVRQEGRALAVSISKKAGRSLNGKESLEDLVEKALSPYIEDMPDVFKFIDDHTSAVDKWESDRNSYLNY